MCKIFHFSQLNKLVKTISLIWDYFTILTFTIFAISLLKKSIYLGFVIYIFASLFSYLFLTSFKFYFSNKSKEEKKLIKPKIRKVKFCYKINKLAIALIPFFAMFLDLNNSYVHPTLLKLVMMGWLVFTIVLEIAFNRLTRMAKRLVESKTNQNS